MSDESAGIGQWISSLFSALPLFGERHIFNAGAYQGARRAKPYQILAAREVGFATPETMVTNSITELEQIGSESLVFKPVNELVHDAAGRPLTTGFNLEELKRLTDAVEAHPAIYQSRVSGVREWRVHVFGGEVFAFHQPGVALDCDRVDVRRRGSTLLQPSQEGLAEDVSEKCRAFLARMRWDIGVFDLIEMQDGAFVFVECNHDGQWYWAVDRFRTPLPAALAEVFDRKLSRLSKEIRECSSAQSSR